MRSWAISRSRSAFSDRDMAAYSEQVASGERQVRAVQSIEVELLDAFTLQAAAEIAGHGGSDHATCFDIVVEALEHVGEPGGHFGAAEARHLQDALEVRHRHDAWHHRHVDAGGRGLVAKAQEVVGLEEELGDAAVRTGIDL